MLEAHQHVINIVQAKFSATEIVKALHLNVSLAQRGWVGENRILALVEHNSSFALFVVIPEKPKPESFLDLTIESAIPIDQYFTCDTDPIPGSYTHIIFNINYKKIKLQFNIEIGFESSNFASEVIRSKEVGSCQINDYQWVEKYNSSGITYIEQIEMDEQPSSNIPISRQKIAQGHGISANRESFLRYQLSLREPEYTHKQEFTVFVGTWNLNGQPSTVSLKPWLSCDSEPPDVYAIGFQELDLSKEAFLMFDTPREAEWRKAIADAIHPDTKYRSVAYVRLVGMQLEVLVNNSHYKYIKNVAIDTVGTGILGKMGNKGGVAVRLELHNTSLCFVNAHLAAGVEEVERRNQDYNDINQRVNFRRHPFTIKEHDLCVCIIHRNVILLIHGAGIDEDYKDLMSYIVCEGSGRECMLRHCNKCPSKDNFVKISYQNLRTTIMKTLSSTVSGFRAQLSLKETVSSYTAVISMDVSENYAFTIQEEPQCYHWISDSCTIHPVMINCKGASNKKLILPLCIISDDLKYEVYWLGDLNYRIMDQTALQVKKCLEQYDLVSVLLADQLNQQKDLSRVLQDYREGDITFPPTYKYDLNTDLFDTSEKARAPAWTDRILWRGNGICQSVYRSHMELKISDHKPVSALFKSEILVVDQTKYRKVHEEMLKKLDKLENEFLPQVTVDQTEVTFDLVKFREPQCRDIIIANTGQVLAEFEFIKKLDDVSYCKEWLSITPYSGCIKPGEKCDIRLKVDLDQPLEKIYDILVLHLVGGKDMFITVSGECQRSCFTTSLSTLCRAPVPLLQLTADQIKHAENQQSPVLYSVPRELWLLVDHLYRNGLKTKDLFESSALHDEILRIRDWLDTGSLDPIRSIHAVAEALLLFLSFTRDPVIPYHLHDSCIAASSNYQNCKQIVLQKMPDLDRNVFLYLCMFLQELLKYSSENGTDAKTLATLFGDILLRDPIRNSRPQANRGKASFVYHFLVNDSSPLIIPNK